MAVDEKRVAAAVTELLEAIGEDPKRPGLVDTPKRVASFYTEILAGNDQDPSELMSRSFDLGHDELVVIKDIEVASICEHHLLPFTGKAHIGYIPGPSGRVAGLSQLTRLIEVFAKRLQLQEQLTTQVADAMVESLNPRGAIVVMECEHQCMTIRGVAKPGAKTITSAVRGSFRKAETRAEALSLILSRN